MTLPTQDEIVARIEAVKESDMFGAQVQELLPALDFAHAQPYLKDGVTESDWEGLYKDNEEDLRQSAREYYEFAIGKATDHRGLSAARSIDHYKGWVFLLANDKVGEFEDTDYAQYGVPQLKLAAELLGFPEEWDRRVAAGLMKLDHSLTNMSVGRPCEDGCTSGCGKGMEEL